MAFTSSVGVLRISRMVVVGEDLSPAPHQAIEPLRDADAEPLHPARKRGVGIRLHDQVQMVAQDRELDDAQPEASERVGEALLHHAEAPPRPQVPDVLAHPEREVERRGLVEPGPGLVGNEPAGALRLAPGTRTPPTAARKGKLPLRGAHLIGDILSPPAHWVKSQVGDRFRTWLTDQPRGTVTSVTFPSAPLVPA